MQLPSEVPARARRAAFKVLADTIAENGCFGTDLHRLALKAMRSRDAEQDLWSALYALPEETQAVLLGRLRAIHENAPAVVREYVTRGIA